MVLKICRIAIPVSRRCPGLIQSWGPKSLKKGENRFAHRLPTPAKYSNLVLKRGVVTETALLNWFRNAIENFDFDPVTVKVSLLNEESDPLINWSFVGVYPVKWSVSNLDAQKNDVMIDTIELAYKYFTKST
ncbi:MAG: phage tail protein [Balneolaceae bacterium]|nr:phage tail protein [Balneolaceae bacterium]